MRIILFSVSLLALFGGELSKVSAQWAQTAGMQTEEVTSLAGDSANLYAGTFNGVFRSTDSGTNWKADTIGYPHSSQVYYQFIYSMAVVENRVLAGTAAGVYGSAIGGASWDYSNTGMPDTLISCLAVLGSKVYAGVNSFFHPGLVFVSSDRGITWIADTVGLPSKCTAHTFASLDTDVFVGTDAGLFRSSVNSGRWTNVTMGLPGRYINSGSLAVSGNKIMVCYGIDSANLFVSLDRGDSWKQEGSVSTVGPIDRIAASGAHVVVWARWDSVLLSTDYGGSWLDFGYGLPSGVPNVFIINGSTVFAGTGSGVWRRPLGDVKKRTVAEVTPSLKLLSLASFPDPSATRTNIVFTLPASGEATITISDVAGSEWPVFAYTEFASGKHEVTCDISTYPAGVYLLRLRCGGRSVTQKLVIAH